MTYLLIPEISKVLNLMFDEKIRVERIEEKL